jgi:hypothetical protein
MLETCTSPSPTLRAQAGKNARDDLIPKSKAVSAVFDISRRDWQTETELKVI